MTSKERLLELGRMHEERASLQKQLTCLEYKAGRTASVLEAAGKSLRNSVHVRWGLDESGQLVFDQNRCPSPEEIHQLLQDLLTTKRRLAKVKEYLDTY